MTVEIKYNGDNVIANDGKGNEIYYIKQGGYLKILFASFNGISYNKTDTRWKRARCGSVSKSFYDWFEEFDNEVYEKHYRK